MKKLKFSFVFILLAAYLIVISDNVVARETTQTKGLKGSINGIFTCHCPDDKGDCYCSMSL